MTQFIEYIQEILVDFGSITSRAMFGGHGIYHRGVMFALVSENELYLKVDDETRPLFEQIGLQPFEYIKKGQVFKMSYYRAPEDMLDDAQAAQYWAHLAYQAATRAAAKKLKQ